MSFLTDFFIDLAEEIPEDVEEMSELIFKMRKVESNLYYLLREEKKGKTLSGEGKSSVYEEAKVPL